MGGKNVKASYETGIMGEEIAENYLKARGMRTLERRNREKTGEIDLIMEDGQTLVFVEVKARFSQPEAGNGLRAVTPGKQKRIAKSAMIYMARHGWLSRSARFDVIEINRNGILHIPNAFQPGGMMF